jgi:hypothetical protein
LPALLADAGIEPLGFKTQCIDRREPIDSNLQAFLQAYFARLTKRVLPYLDPGEAQKLSELIDPSHDAYLFHQPHLTVTWLNMLAWGRRP